MSKVSNTQRVREIYAAFGRGDIPAVLNALASDVMWVVQGPSSVPHCGTRNGREGVAAFFRAIGENLAIKEFAPGVVVGDGDRVVVIGYERGTAVPTGRPYQTEWVHVFTFFDGQVIEFREYADTAALVEAFRGASRSAA